MANYSRAGGDLACPKCGLLPPHNFRLEERITLTDTQPGGDEATKPPLTRRVRASNFARYRVCVNPDCDFAMKAETG